MSSRRSLQGRSRVLLAVLAVLAWAALAGCSQPQVVAPTTLVVPSQISVYTINLGGVYDTLAEFANHAGLMADPAQSSRQGGRLVTQSALCAPNGDQRHTARCVFSFSIAPAQDNPLQVAVQVRVRAGQRVPFDPYTVAQQVRIEATLDQIVTALRTSFGAAAVTQTDMLEF